LFPAIQCPPPPEPRLQANAASASAFSGESPVSTVRTLGRHNVLKGNPEIVAPRMKENDSAFVGGSRQILTQRQGPGG